MTLRPMSATAAIALLAALVAAAAAPRRFVVDGLSMAPGLMPGAVVATGWFPAGDRLTRPDRLETWVVAAPDGERAVKRLIGLPGDVVAVASGDVLIDGEPLLKQPPELAQVAVPVPIRGVVAGGRLEIAPREVLDDAAFAREVNRPLEPVADVGMTVTIRAADLPGSLVAGVEDARIGWRVAAGERCVVLAGRLDGHVVAVAWRVHRLEPTDAGRPLPDRVPRAWSVATRRTSVAGRPTLSPGLSLESDPPVVVEDVRIWRDVLVRPTAGGTTSWRLGPDEHLLLGDFPTGSVDGRQWGPLPRRALRQRVSRLR
ncbi:MAG: S26 family signal peptidase [Planctomycetota bacterium]